MSEEEGSMFIVSVGLKGAEKILRYAAIDTLSCNRVRWFLRWRQKELR